MIEAIAFSGMILFLGLVAIAAELRKIAKHLDDIRLAQQQQALYAGEELKVSSGAAAQQKWRA